MRQKKTGGCSTIIMCFFYMKTLNIVQFMTLQSTVDRMLFSLLKIIVNITLMSESNVLRDSFIFKGY